MTIFGSVRMRDEVILVARILLVVIFVALGWSKLTNYTGTVGYMALIDAPMPYVVALMAIVVEILVTLAIAFGAWTRSACLTARALHIVLWTELTYGRKPLNL
jgi:putative oxidoreductase